MRYCLFIFSLSAFLSLSLFSQSTNISEGNIFDGEPFMLVNPQNQQHIIIVWMGFDGFDLIKIKERVSFNGGNTWSEIIEIPHITSGFTSADPSMEFDSDGNVYLCFIDYNPAGTAGAVLVYKSSDGGLTWNAATEVIDAFADGFEIPIDRPWITIDRSGGSNDGNIYITTKPAPWIPFPNRNYFISSTNNGVSYNDWRYIDTIGWRIGSFIQAPMATPAVSAVGIFHTIYPAWEFTENILPRFILASSENAGGTFTYREVIESGGDELITDTSAKVGYLLKCNPTDPNHLAFFTILQTAGDADIYLFETFNAGNTWNEQVRVNDDPINTGKMQDLVWANFDLDGDLLVSWRDRRNAADTGFSVSSEIYGVIRWKDSLEFSDNFKISNTLVEFDDVLLGSGNDFMCNAMINDTIYAVWGDTRDGFLNIWFNKISANTLSGTGIQNITSESKELITIYPNPSSNFVTIDCKNMFKLFIYDILGNCLLTMPEIKNDLVYIDISKFPIGIYTVKIITNSQKEFSRQFTKN